jgi:hypothetical protein
MENMRGIFPFLLPRGARSMEVSALLLRVLAHELV